MSLIPVTSLGADGPIFGLLYLELPYWSDVSRGGSEWGRRGVRPPGSDWVCTILGWFESGVSE